MRQVSASVRQPWGLLPPVTASVGMVRGLHLTLVILVRRSQIRHPFDEDMSYTPFHTQLLARHANSPARFLPCCALVVFAVLFVSSIC